MKIKHLKKWLEGISAEFDDHELVFREVVCENDNDGYMIAKDNPVHACGVDEDNDEVYFCDIETHHIIEKNSK